MNLNSQPDPTSGGLRLTADDALRLKAELTDWLSTPDAARVQVDFWEGDSLRVEEVLGPPLEVSAGVNAGLSHRLRETTPIWCDRDMTDLLAAATAAFPVGAIGRPVIHSMNHAATA